MHGGILCTQNIVVVQQNDLLIAAFSHHLYFFSLAEATIIRKVTHHEAQIVALHYEPNNRIFTSVDQNGGVFTAQIDTSGKFVDSRKTKIDISEALVSAEVCLGKNREITVFSVSQNGKLVRFVEGVTGIIAQNVQKLLYVSQELLIVRSSKTHLLVYDTATLHLKYEYRHQFEVHSVEIYRLNLIVGDTRGKINILNNFLKSGETQIKQKLEWHVHEVSCLKTQQSYLYSGGEEGVVVLWHLRENKRDFLPRVGAQIINIKIMESKVYCILADNTIKSIDLNNDKAVLHYKTIVSPTQKWLAPSSTERVSTNLVRVSPRQDQIYLRSQPGRIQNIHLGNGVNSQLSIVGRNATSRLDKNLPNPHQITDIAFSKDGTQFVSAIQGTNCCSLKFYFQDEGTFQLLSKVENCHRGAANIRLLSFGDHFVSYSASDLAIKVWRRMTRRKESILEVEQHYWACEYEIGYRQKTHQFVSAVGENLTVLYDNEFVLFNTRDRKIQGVYSFDSAKVIAVYQLEAKLNAFLVVYQNYVEKIDFSGKKQHTQRIIDISKDNSSFNVDQIVFNQKDQTFAFLVDLQHQQNVYIYTINGSVQLLEIEITSTRITDIFWVGHTLASLDSGLIIYNLSNDKQLVHFEQKQESRVVDEQMEEEQTQINDYQHLYTKYLQRQFRRDRTSIDKASEMMQVTPSLTSSLQLLTSQLFL